MTLLEVIIALALMSVLLSGVYIFYSNTLRTRETADDLTTNAQLDRTTIKRIADDVRCAAGYMPGFGVGLIGDRHSVALYRYVMPEPDVFNEYNPDTDQLPPAKADLRKIEWRLHWDPENEDENGDPICHGLERTVQRTLNQVVVTQTKAGSSADMSFDLNKGTEEKDGEAPEEPNLGAEGELVAPEIKYLEFYYFDGADWTDEWKGGGNQENALPQAVMITIGRVPLFPEDEEIELETLGNEELELYHPDRVSMIVRLYHSDRFLTSRVVNARTQLADLESGLRSENDSFKRSLRGSGFGGRRTR